MVGQSAKSNIRVAMDAFLGFSVKCLFIFNFPKHRAIFKRSNIQRTHLSQKFMIVVTNFVENTTHILNEIFELFWKNGLINSHVLLQENATWSLYMFMPYQSDCISLSQVRVTSFTLNNFTESLSQSLEELYPEKLKNFNGCNLKVAVTNNPPFNIFPKKPNETLGGIDHLIVKNIAKSLNFTVIGKTSKENRGQLFANGTTTGNFKLVLTNEADFITGGNQRTETRSSFLLESDAILYSSLTFVYTEDKIQQLNIIRLFAPFKPYLWFIIWTIIFLTIFLILLTKKLTRKWRHFYIGGRINRTPILNLWAAILGKSIGNRRISNGRTIGNFARTLILFWILLWFVIRSCYEGVLYSKMQNNQHYSPFDTIEKIQKSKCKILLLPSAYPYLSRFIDKER